MVCRKGKMVAVLAMMAFVLPLAGCESGDPTAPADSTIEVSATPATVVVDPNAGISGVSLITGILRAKNGTRLKDQEMTFTTSQGTLTDTDGDLINPGDPQLTDDSGVASAILTTTQTATVTARSGNITGTVTVQTASGEVSSIILNLSTTSVDDCDDTITVTARVVTSGGQPVAGLPVEFFQNTPPSLHDGIFTNTVVISDAAGESTTTWRPSQATCLDDCSVATGGTNCDPMAEIQASDISKTIFSNIVTVNDDID
jgi:hypothetical protein